jgi:uncharacterized protein
MPLQRLVSARRNNLVGSEHLMEKILTIAQLEDRYGKPLDRALWKEIDQINAHYRKFIEHCPFVILATSGTNGIDCSPRGDPAGFIRVVDDKHIQIPDRRGNNRLDSLHNIITNPAVGIIFIIPNVGETIRLSGTAEILTNAELCKSFAINGTPASSVISIRVSKVYYQCQKAIARSRLWDPSTYIQREQLPSAGDMTQFFAHARNVEFDGKKYDQEYPEYIRKTIY